MASESQKGRRKSWIQEKKKIEEVTAENSNLVKGIILQIQETQWTSSSVNSKKAILIYIIIKLLKIKDKKPWRQWEPPPHLAPAAQHLQYTLGSLIIVVFSSEITEARRQWKKTCEVLKEKTVNPEFDT